MKHKKMRGVVAMLLTLVMMVGMLPTSVYASDADGGGDNRTRESRQLNQLAEYRAQQKHREIELHKADHFFHKQAGKGRADRARVGEEHRAEGGDRRKEDHAVSTVGCQHQ